MAVCDSRRGASVLHDSQRSSPARVGGNLIGDFAQRQVYVMVADKPLPIGASEPHSYDPFALIGKSASPNSFVIPTKLIRVVAQGPGFNKACQHQLCKTVEVMHIPTIGGMMCAPGVQ